MAVSLTSLPEGLFARIGRLSAEYSRVVSSYGASLNAAASQIASGYRTNEGVVTDNLFATRDAYRGVHGSYLSALTAMAQNTIIEQVNRDQPLSPKTLQTALDVLFTQMEASSDSVQRPTTSTTIAADAGNRGDGVVTASLTNQWGDPIDTVFPETLRLTVPATPGTQYSETLNVAGEPSRPVTDFQWPGGSGVSSSIQFFDAALDDILTNGDFADWTGSPVVLGTWVYTGGATTTSVQRSGTTFRTGTSYTAQFVSDGTVLPAIYQTVTLEPNTVYALNLWARVSALDSSGIFRVRLTDSSNTTLTNDAAANLLYTRNLNGNIGTSWTQVSTFFQTPRQLPSAVRLHLEWTTTPSSGKTMNMALCGFKKVASPLYSGGPYLAAWSASAPVARADKYTVVVANNAAVGGFSRFLQRTCGTSGTVLYPPSASSPTVSDTLAS